MAAGDAQPGLAVSLNGPAGQVREGEQAAYTIEVRNTSDTAYPAAVITQLLPPGLSLAASEPAGTVGGSQVQWVVAVPARGTAVVRTTGTVGRIADARAVDSVVVQQKSPSKVAGPTLVTTACVQADGGSGVAGCASATERLVSASGDAGWFGGSGAVWGVSVASGVLVAVATGVGVVLVRRRRGSRGDEPVTEYQHTAP
ncbi:hypothetical protein [Kitasatospora sp. McL0602]|uniref:hypothetical protein n=1 Tax=Kitasatospora sp. McL0602 TaxID=3439530 RepID=UPI003F8CB33C